MLLAMAVVVLKVIALVFERIEGLSCFTKSGSYFMLQVLCRRTLGIFSIVSRSNPFEGKCRKMLCVDLQVIG